MKSRKRPNYKTLLLSNQGTIKENVRGGGFQIAKLAQSAAGENVVMGIDRRLGRKK